jgi:hypothetical protein
VQYERDHLSLAPLEIRRVLQRHADGRSHRAGVDQRKPAERDDAEQQLRRVARGRIVQPQLGADSGKSFLSGG